MNIGERVGDYEIVEILGSGGMGQVYKVRNTLSERLEAMKVLLPNLESDAGLADRFLREIKVQAALDHPNIAKLHTAMRAGNQLLMFMEFVDGVAVSKQIERGPLPSADAAAIAAQVLDALTYAHAHGVVHRDIKPANIMQTSSGVVKLMDFGIARMQADTRLTQTGGAVGSLFYMSPEQIRGAEPDPRSDVYSLGVTLYEMATGRRPFAGDSDYEIMSAHLQQTPPAPAQLVDGIPPDLSEIILTAIAKDPAARFQSAAAFRAALSNVFPALPASPTGTRTAVPPPVPVPAAAAAPPPPPGVGIAPPPLPQQAFVAPPPVPPAPPFAASAAPIPPPVSIPPPPMPVATASKSNRGLYMAVGSIVTLLVLIAAVIEGPKLMHGGSSSASDASSPAAAAPASPAAQSTSPATADSPAPAAAGTDPAAVSAPAAGTASAAAGTASAAAVTEGTAPAASPATPPATTAASSPGWKPVGQSAAAAQAQAQTAPRANAPVNAAPAPQAFQPQPAPQAQAPAQPVPVQPAPAQRQAAAPAPAANREYTQLRQQFNELSIRANSASAGLQSFQQQQSGQGLGLRADIREAKTRLDYQLQEAMTQMSSGDYEGARQSMRYAQSAVDTIDKFLGR